MSLALSTSKLFERIKNVISSYKLEFVAVAIAMMLSSVVLYFVESKTKDSLLNLVRSNLNRNEISSNPLKVAQEIENLESMDVLKCSRLRMDGQSDLFLDLSFKRGCRGNSFFFSENDLTAEIFSSSGQLWILESKFFLNNETQMLLIFLKILLVSISLLTVRFYKIKIDSIETTKNIEIKKLGLFADVAKQVAHDIRSPLSALTMISATVDELPEAKRILIRSSIQRINDIANDLLQRAKDPIHNVRIDNQQDHQILASEDIELCNQFVPALLDEIVSEKRMQYREFSGINIDVDLSDRFGFFAEVDGVELKRAISNLVNNSIEAFDNKIGSVIVGVRSIGISLNGKETLEIFIADNGKGISSEVLRNLGTHGYSFGKNQIGINSHSGQGIGVYHAKSTIESFGGSFLVDSTLGLGTTVRMQIPISKAPSWFASEIDLSGVEQIVSLDDDVSIHQIWSERLSTLGNSNLYHFKFQSGQEFRQYVLENRERLDVAKYLIDFELLNQSMTGLDLIEELGIENNSILVTSRYEDRCILERSEKLGLKILPKSLSGFVPLICSKTKVKFDAILVDDDSLMHAVWEFEAKSKGKAVKCYFSGELLMKEISSLDFRNAIYIDVNLGDGESGEDLAKKLFERGFKNLYLATGYEPDEFKHLDWLMGVVGKEFPLI